MPAALSREPGAAAMCELLYDQLTLLERWWRSAATLPAGGDRWHPDGLRSRLCSEEVGGNLLQTWMAHASV